MRAGANLGCHQLPERSFYFKQYQFPVCARCCGVFIGEILALICTVKKKRISTPISIACMFAMLSDWLIQYIEIKESTNKRRLLTGVFGGFGCWSLISKAICNIFKKIKK